MTTPSTFNTPYAVICDAYLESKLIQLGDTPSSEQLARGRNRIQDMVNQWQTQGLKLWLQFDQPVTLVAGQASYSLMVGGDVNITKPTRVIQGYYVDSSANRRPIYPIGREEYDRLSTVVQQGQLNSYFTDKLYDRLQVYFWLVPDATAATGIAYLVIQKQIQEFVALNDTMQFPVEWKLALIWGLADELAGGQPQAIMDRCQQRAMMYKMQLEDWDVEDAPTSFAADSRMMANQGQFR